MGILQQSFVQILTLVLSPGTQNVILIMVSAASMVAGLATNIQNPANKDIEVKLHASPSEISWSLSLFVLVQGNVPLMWAAIGEIKGRKV
jgi:MFS family permease